MRAPATQVHTRQANGTRLTARPKRVEEHGLPGLQPLRLDLRRDALLYVPNSYSGHDPLPMVVMLHPEGGNERQGMEMVRSLLGRREVIVLAPASRGQTWDVVLGDYGADAHFINRALQRVFAEYAVAPERVAIAGASDGASYALILGTANPELFTHCIAVDPGPHVASVEAGAPRVFLAAPAQRADSMASRLSASGMVVTKSASDSQNLETVLDEALTWLLR